MINGVESFLKINEDTTGEQTSIHVSLNSFDDINDSMMGRQNDPGESPTVISLLNIPVIEVRISFLSLFCSTSATEITRYFPFLMNRIKSVAFTTSMF